VNQKKKKDHGFILLILGDIRTGKKKEHEIPPHPLEGAGGETDKHKPPLMTQRGAGGLEQGLCEAAYSRQDKHINLSPSCFLPLLPRGSMADWRQQRGYLTIGGQPTIAARSAGPSAPSRGGTAKQWPSLRTKKGALI
jgi:hypothetical protein